jgi:hypothetical protein
MPDTHQSVAAIDLLFSMACRHVDVAEYPRARAGGRPPLKTSENRPGWGANAQLCGDRFPAVGIGFQNPAPMLLAQNNHMIDTLAPDRSDQPFGKAILPRRGWSNGLVPDAHGTQSARDDSAGDSIPISDHIARSHVPGRRLVDLTCNPLRRRVGCDVYRLAPKLGARKKIGLERIEDELALLPTSFLSGLRRMLPIWEFWGQKASIWAPLLVVQTRFSLIRKITRSSGMASSLPRLRSAF